MTIPPVGEISPRIGEIRSQLEAAQPAARSFAAALDAAANDAPSSAAVGYEPPFESASLPVGILGTPIILRAWVTPLPGDDSWAANLPSAGRPWAGEIEAAANRAGIDPRLLAAMVWQESGFRPDAVSRSGAIGLAQLMPGTADGLDVDPWNPTENLDGGARYLAWTIEEFGSIELGLAAYNAGPGRVREAGGIPNIAETQAYVPRVLDYYRQLGGVA